MQIAISKIKIQNRIREDYGDIQSLSDSIKKVGLIQPIVITNDDVLIAGERRLKAAQLLNAEYIEARVMDIKDYEKQLEAEIAENELRKEFTFEERVKYGKELEQIERLKAEERKLSTLKQNSNTDVEKFPPREEGKTRDIVATKVGFGSGKQYEKAKTVVEQAPEPIKEAARNNVISINKAYEATKVINKMPEEKKQDVVKQIVTQSRPVKEIINDCIKKDIDEIDRQDQLQKAVMGAMGKVIRLTANEECCEAWLSDMDIETIKDQVETVELAISILSQFKDYAQKILSKPLKEVK
jgi:ParB family chromosome partitioning protein